MANVDDGMPDADTARYVRLKFLGQCLSEFVASLPLTAPPGKTRPEPQSPFVRAMEARAILGGRGVVERCERAEWFAPVKRGKRLTLYRRVDIEAAVARIGWGELPQ